jgi:hypothetical protein
MATVKKIFEWMFYLIENTITADATDKLAKIKSHKTKTVDDIAAHIVSERTEYRKETIVNIMSLANEAKLKFLSQGETVNDGLIIYEPSITGNFYESTLFDDSRNSCIVNTRVGTEIHKMLRQAKGVYNGLTVENGGASIDGVTDAATGEVNGIITPTKTITITGKKIRVVPEEGESLASCITYTNLTLGLVTSQEDPPAVNDPGKIILQLPDLEPGLYNITIKTLFSTTSTTLKAPRFITSKLKLEVKA